MPSKMSLGGSQCHMLEQPSWSSPSASPSPPPPPLPPPVAARWARTEQNSQDSCPHCRGRLASLPTRTTSLSSYSCKDRSTPVPRPPDDEDSFPVICDRDFHSLHRNIPALRRRDVDTTTIKQHYYPEGGWGWLVCGAAFLAHLLTSGMQLAFGLLYLYTMKFLIKSKSENEREFYVMATGNFLFRFSTGTFSFIPLNGPDRSLLNLQTTVLVPTYYCLNFQMASTGFKHSWVTYLITSAMQMNVLFAILK